MLRYKLNITSPNTWSEIDCIGNVWISSDGSIISGKTYDNFVYNKQTVKVAVLQSESSEFIPNEWSDYVIHSKRVKEQGYVIVTRTFNVDSDGDWYSFLFVNGQYYVWKKNSDLVLGVSWADIESINDDKITINIKYYVYDGIITIDGVDYEVDYSNMVWNLDENGKFDADLTQSEVSVFINGETKEVYDYLPSQWTDATLFTISQEDNVQLSFDEVKCSNKTYTYPLDNESLLVFDHGSAPFVKNNVYYRLNMSSTTPYIEYNTNMDMLGDWSMLEDFNTEHLLIEYKDAPYGDYINLYIKDVSHAIPSGSKILAKSHSLGNCNLLVMRDSRITNDDNIENYFYIDIDGSRYSSIDGSHHQYVKHNDMLLQLYDNPSHGNANSLTSAYTHLYYLPNSSTPLYANGGVEYPYITINGYDYPIINHDDKFPYIQYEKSFEYELYVERSINNNAITCSVVGEYIDGMAKIISANYKDFTFELVLPMLPKWIYEKPTFYYTKNGRPFPLLKIYGQSEPLSIPISLENSISQNLNQSELIDEYFTDVELGKRVNGIVDMEKDIYYPAYKNGDDFFLLNGIKFHLHFRERDASWKIIEDGYWNMLSSTENESDIHKKLTHKYYQESDLLGYLGFINNDVFYMKKKLSKSFLRMSYFDSANVKKQSLLYTATSFLDKNLLYKKYIDNSQINRKVTWKNDNITQHFISVDMEPNDNDENKRLDCTIHLQNRYESSISSEGFYLYLFRDFAQPYKPRRIYLRTNFSHAGYGQTLTFICPTTQTTKLVFKNDTICKCGEKLDAYQIMPWIIDQADKSVMDGCPLNEIYSKIHLPLNVMYCEKLGQYIYFFDEEFTNEKGVIDENGVLHLNLYELKIKDESIVKK